jgi:hypothetical protein
LHVRAASRWRIRFADLHSPFLARDRALSIELVHEPGQGEAMHELAILESVVGATIARQTEERGDA